MQWQTAYIQSLQYILTIKTSLCHFIQNFGWIFLHDKLITLLDRYEKTYMIIINTQQTQQTEQTDWGLHIAWLQIYSYTLFIMQYCVLTM